MRGLSTRLEKRNYTLKNQSSKFVEVEIKEPEVLNKIKQNFNTNAEYDDFKHYMLSSSKKNKHSMADVGKVTIYIFTLQSLRNDSAAADIPSNVFEDIGVITITDAFHVIDQLKIRREKSHIRKNFQQSKLDSDEMHDSYFDGRKTDTLVIKII